MANEEQAKPNWDAARRLLGENRLSVVMPAYNLGAHIQANIHHVHEVLSGNVPFEIIVVDDGSPDATGAEARAAAADLENVSVISLAENAGKGAAVRRGIMRARGSYVLLLDGDLDLPPAQAARFFEVMESEQVDVVIGSKRHPDSDVESYPWHRRFISTVYFAIVKLLMRMPIRDSQTGIKLFKKETLDWAVPRWLVKRFAMDLELLTIIHAKGYRIGEAPVTLHAGGSWAVPSPTSVTQIFHDTLAVFYRNRILDYYRSIPDTHIPDPPPLVSIVIAYPAGTGFLDECLAGIRRQTYTHYEVILLPDAASGRAWPDGIREIPTGPVRPAEKRNRGIREAKGEIVAFLDDDAAPLEDWLEHVLGHFSNPAVAAVGGPSTTPRSDPYLAQIGGRVYQNVLVSGPQRLRYFPTRVQDIEDFPSCNLIVRRDTLDKLKGFDETYWPGEDTHLCLQIVKTLGKRIVYEPRAVVTHHRRRLLFPHLRQIARYGFHRGHFAKRFPETSCKLSYMVPSLFVLGLLLGGIAAVLWPPLQFPYLAAVFVYLLVTLVASFSVSPLAWILTWQGVILTHIVYGIRFLMGLFAPSAPDAPHRFDHPSEKKGDS